MINASYAIPEHVLPALRARLDPLVRRADKLGVPLAYEVGEPVDTALGTGAVRRAYPVTISGDAPRLAGWRLIAALSHIDGAVIIRAVPGQDDDIPHAYRTEPPACDHCRLARQRANTYVLAHEDGRITRVGSSCLADFLGHVDPHSLTAWLEVMLAARAACEQGEDEERGGGGEAWRWSLSAFLSVTARMIRQHGWLGRTKARESGDPSAMPTADRVLHVLTCRHGDGRCWHAPIDDDPRIPDDCALADAAKAWACSLGTSGKALTDYEWNVTQCAALGSIDARLAGIAASIVSSYQRTLAPALGANGASHHFGTLKKREVFTLTVDHVRSIEGNYGLTTLYRMHDGTGNVAVWFASGSGPGWEPGDVVTVKATVKRHETRNRVAETHLNRCIAV